MGAIFTWLNTNSGAVTALAAIVGVIITGFYTWITRKLANIAVQQRDVIAAQHEIQATQVKYMLYERRVKVLKAVLHIVEIAREREDISDNVISKFYDETAESRYIFGDDIRGYIHELKSNVKNIQMLHMRHEQMLDDSHNAESVLTEHEEEIRKMQAWFLTQESAAPKKFAPYLQIEDESERPQSMPETRA
jgi:hypothetical protein